MKEGDERYGMGRWGEGGRRETEGTGMKGNKEKMEVRVSERQVALPWAVVSDGFFRLCFLSRNVCYIHTGSH